MFSGIGGFELGLQQAYENKMFKLKRGGSKSSLLDNRNQSNNQTARAETEPIRNVPENIGYSEIDKYACQIYSKHFPTHKNYGDATKIQPDTIPDFDFLVAGFPCQSFSIAGKRGGFDDTRGTLFFDIARILKVKRPRMFLLENVKGLLSHDTGRTFKTIIATLAELGYDIQWQVLNSKNFGVPQNRERVFIIGHLRGEPRPKVFPIGESNKLFINGGNEKRQRRGIEPRRNLSELTGGRGNPKSLKIRRLTPVECERLQGFPDGWTEGISDTRRYQTLGNAVTVNVIKAIMERLTPIN